MGNLKHRSILIDTLSTFLSQRICKYISLFILVFILICSGEVKATHIVGGDLTYRCLGNDNYEITLSIRRDCRNGADDAPFDDPASISIFDADGNNLIFIGSSGQLLIPFSGADTLFNEVENICFGDEGELCVHISQYVRTVNLPQREGGYILAYQRCCRNGTLNNLANPLETGMTLQVAISEESLAVCNSSPTFVLRPDLYICAGEPLTFDHSATDIDGDSLVYRVGSPYTGATIDDPKPAPTSRPPFDFVEFLPGFGINDFMSGTPLSINAEGGSLTATPRFVGQYLIGICVDEYRDGVLLSTVHREFQYNVVVCNNDLQSNFEYSQNDCGSALIEFTNMSESADEYSWFFDWPEKDFSSEEVSPTFTYSEPGIYTVRLEARNTELDCEDFFEQEVVVLDASDNAIDYEITSCNGEHVTIELTDVSGIQSGNQNWTVTINGNQSSLVGSPVSFNAARGDNVNVRLEISSGDSDCQSLEEISIQTDLDALTNFDFAFVECADDQIEIRFYNTSQIEGLNLSNVTWELTTNSGQNLTGNGSSFSATLDEGESVFVRMTLLFDNGCSVTSEREVDVNLDHYIDFETIFDGCSNRVNEVDLILRSLGNQLPGGANAIAWNWTIVNGDNEYVVFLSQTRALVDLSEPVTITLNTRFENQCSASVTKTLDISDIFEADLSITEESLECVADQVTLRFSNEADQILGGGASISSKTWTITNDNETVEERGDLVEYTATKGDIINVTLRIRLSNGCILDIVEEVEVLGVDIIFNTELPDGDEIFVCSGGTVPLINNPNPDWTYEWSPTTGLTFQDENDLSNPIANPSTTTTYNVTVTNGGCQTSGSVTVIPQDDVQLLISNGDGGSTLSCEGNVNLTVSGGTGTYEWSLDENFNNIIFEGPTYSTMQTVAEQRYFVRTIIDGGACASNATSIDIQNGGLSNNDFEYEITACSGSNVDVTFRDVTTGTVMDRLWTITINGVETTSADQSVSISAARTDEVMVSLYIMTLTGCEETQEENINLNLDELVDFDLSIDQCSGDQIEVTFTNRLHPDGGLVPSEINWVFRTADGTMTTANGASVTQSFAQNEVLRVSQVIVYTNGCRAIREQELDLDIANFISFVGSLVNCDARNIATINLTATSLTLPGGADALSYEWRIDNGGSITTLSGEVVRLTVDFNDPVLVSLSQNFVNGCSGTLTREVTVGEILGLGGEIPIDIIPQTCTDESLIVNIENTLTTVLDGTVSITNKSWTVTGASGSVTGTGDQVTYSGVNGEVVDIVFTITLSNGCIFDIRRTDTIESPSITFNTDVPDGDQIFVCNGDAVAVVTNPNSDWTYEWSPTTGLTFEDPEDRSNPLASPTIATTYNVTVTSGACQAFGSVRVVPQNQVDLEILINGNGPLTICDGQALLTVNGGNGVYEWSLTEDFTDIISTTDSLVVSQTAERQDYYVRSILSNGACISNFETIELLSGGLFNNDFSYEITSCEADQINLTLKDETTANVIDRLWTINIDGQSTTSTASEVSISADRDAIVDLTLMIRTGVNCEETQSQIIDLNIDDRTSFDIAINQCSDDQVRFTLTDNTDAGGGLLVESVRWIFLTADGNTTTATGPVVTQSFAQNEIVLVTQSIQFEGGCSAEKQSELSTDIGDYIDFTTGLVSCQDQNQVTVNLISAADNLPGGAAAQSWDWTINNGGISTFSGRAISVDLDFDNPVFVSLTISYDNGCTGTRTRAVTIGEVLGLEDGFGIDADPQNCNGTTITTIFSNDVSEVLNGVTVTNKEWMIGMGGTGGGEPNPCANSSDVSLAAEDVMIAQGQATFCMDFNVSQFDNISGVQTGISWNPELIEFMGINQGALSNTDANLITPGSLRIVWTTALGADPVNLEDGATAFTLCFNNVGNTQNEFIEIGDLPNFNTEVISGNFDILPLCTKRGLVTTETLGGGTGEVITATGDQISYTGEIGEVVTVMLTTSFSNGCEFKITEDITIQGVDIELINGLEDGTAFTCIGDPQPIVANPNSDWSYTWSPMEGLIFDDPNDLSNPLVDIVSTMTYNVTVTNGNCTETAEITVIPNTDVVLSVSGDGLVCNDEVNLSVTGGTGVYEWSSDPLFENIIGAGSALNLPLDSDFNTLFIRTVINDACVSNAQEINFSDGIIMADMGLAGDSISICDGMPANLVDNPNFDLTYEWRPTTGLDFSNGNNNPTALPNETTTYTVVVTNGVCIDSAQITVLIPGDLTITIDGLDLATNTIEYCPGDNVTLNGTTGSDPNLIEWGIADGGMIFGNGPNVTFDPGTGAVVFARLTDPISGCQFRTENINIIPFDSGVEVNPVQVACGDENTTINATNTTGRDLNYNWTPEDCIVSGGNTLNPTINIDLAKGLQLTVTDPLLNCSETIDVNFNVSSIDVEVTADPGTEINRGEPVVLDAEINGTAVSILWSSGQESEDIEVTPEETTTYTVTVTDHNGCTSTREITIVVNQPLCDETDIFIPNAFTPNGDNVNDVLLVRSNFIKEMELVVYDRWGRQVFATTSQPAGWNGTFRNTGEELAPDAYAYRLRAVCINDVEYLKQGNVSIIR